MLTEVFNVVGFHFPPNLSLKAQTLFK